MVDGWGSRRGTAFVLGGGGVLGAVEVGMLEALIERGIVPDLVVGSSVGALNGALIAGRPSAAGVGQLRTIWSELRTGDIFTGNMFGQVSNLVRHGTHLHPNGPLREMIDERLPGVLIEDLAVTFQCVAASIERATAHWFSAGPVVDAVLASCAVPGLLPPVEVGGQHYYDGGLVRSVPVGRAIELGARTVYVLHVGRLERGLRPPRRPWEVGMVALEIARRNSFVEEMAALPDGVEVHVLPAGRESPTVSVRYRDTSAVAERIERAHQASATYLDRLVAR